MFRGTVKGYGPRFSLLFPEGIKDVSRAPVPCRGFPIEALVLRQGYHLAAVDRVPVSLVTGAALAGLVALRTLLDALVLGNCLVRKDG